MVVIDATILMLFLRPETAHHRDSGHEDPIEDVPARLTYLIARLERSRSKLLIPTPALSEVLVRANEGANRLVEELKKRSVFQIEAFDERAAIEVAAMTRIAIDQNDKRAGSPDTWAKVKFDRQIVAIARVHSASTIYTDDEGLKTIAEGQGIDVVGLADLPLPPKNAQGEFDFSGGSIDESKDSEEDDKPETTGPDEA